VGLYSNPVLLSSNQNEKRGFE